MLVFSSSLVIAVLIIGCLTALWTAPALLGRMWRIVTYPFRAALEAWASWQVKKAQIEEARAKVRMAEEKAKNEALREFWKE